MRSSPQSGRRAPFGTRRLLLLALAFTSLMVLAGCSRGSYPLDFFPEMHYQQSYKVQEPPSLSAPADAVPITGAEVSYSMEEAKELANPLPGTQATIRRGERLYKVNCAVCHGETAQGDGPMVERLADAGYGGKPPALTTKGPIANKPDGEVYQITTNGFAGAYGLPEDRFVMPAFQKLLEPEERWAIVAYLRSLG